MSTRSSGKRGFEGDEVFGGAFSEVLGGAFAEREVSGGTFKKRIKVGYLIFVGSR